MGFWKTKTPPPAPRRYDSLGRPYSPQGDRILGHEWAGWDGDVEHHEGVIHEPAGLFLWLGGGVLFGYVTLAWALWWATLPRVLQYSTTLPWITFSAGTLLSLLLFSLYGLTALSVLRERNILPFAWSKRMLDGVYRGVYVLGRWVGKDKDHVGNSYVEVWNALQRAAMRAGPREVDPRSLLVLLPRCLLADQFKPIKALCDEYGCQVVTVGRGRHARDKIREICPGGVIGVACERDLVTGINDTKHAIQVMGVNIQRVAGPCKDALVDLDELRTAIEAYFFTVRLPQRE